MQPRRLALVLAVLVLAGGLVAAVLVSGDDDDAAPSTTTLGPAGDEAGREVAELLERGRGEDRHVVLSSGPAAEPAPGTEITVELWQSATGDVRQDLVLVAGALRTETRTIQREDGVWFCQRPTEGAWSCAALGADATGGGLVEAAAAELRGGPVTATDAEVLGRPARCFGDALCLGEDGTPLRLRAQGRPLTATVVDREVPAGVFDLPAEPPTAAG